MPKYPIYVSRKGGIIYSINADSGYLYHVFSDHLSLYCNDLIVAKAHLDRLESLKDKSGNISFQAMNKEAESLRALVESSAAPYITVPLKSLNPSRISIFVPLTFG